MNGFQMTIVLLLCLFVHASMAASPQDVDKALAKFNGTFDMDSYRHKLNDQERHKFDNILVAMADIDKNEVLKFQRLSSALANMTPAEMEKMRSFGLWCWACKVGVGALSAMIGDVASLTEDALRTAMDGVCSFALIWAGSCRAAAHKYLDLIFQTIKDDNGVVAEHICKDIKWC